MPRDKNIRTVRQKDADELHATVTPSPTASPTIVEQSNPSKLKSTVTQAAKDRTITGNIGILDSFDVRIIPAKEDGNLASIKTNTDNLDITQSSFRDALLGANTKDFSTIQTVLDSIKDTDGIKKITDTVTVAATDLDIRDLAKAQDEIYAVLKTDAGIAYDARDRSWTITETVPVSGTFWQATQPISGTVTATQAVSANLKNEPAGNVAHDTVDSGNPLKVGGKAYNFDGTPPGSAVTEGDRTNIITDVYGRPYVETAHPNHWKADDNQSTAQTNKQLKAAPGAGLSLYITDITMSTDTAMNIKLVEDTAGVPADVWKPMYFAANGGLVTNLKTPVKVTANKDLGYTSSAAGNHSLVICGFTAP